MKSDQQDPGPLPDEKTTKRARRPGLPLSDRSIDLVRKVAAHTGIPIGDVLASLAGNEELERHIEKGCKRLAELRDLQREVERNLLFEPPKVPVEGEL
jgi:hypothetical protein